MQSSIKLENETLKIEGSWEIADLEKLEGQLDETFKNSNSIVKSVEFRNEEGLGLNILSLIVDRINIRQSSREEKIEYRFSSNNTAELFDFVSEHFYEEENRCENKSFFHRVGIQAFGFYEETKDVFKFFSELFHDFIFESVLHAELRTRELVSEIDKVAVSAVPIVAMVNFLIGIVISYLLGNQLQYYGANIFVVDGIATAMCRELSPILVAIILAGRSGSAFSAELGSMKMNQEVDSIKVLGLSVNQVLVIPRVLALFLCMPILVFVGDLFGILGGIFISNIHLDVGIENFLDRLQQVLLLKNVYIGLWKGPLFALFIGSIACHLGLGAEPNAVSIGKNTTRTVVRSIVSVIILNAICAVVLSELKI